MKKLDYISWSYTWPQSVTNGSETVHYNCKVKKLVQLPNTRTVRYGNKSLKFRGRILWNTLPDTIKSAKDSYQFNKSIKNLMGSACHCNIGMSRKVRPVHLYQLINYFLPSFKQMQTIIIFIIFTVVCCSKLLFFPRTKAPFWTSDFIVLVRSF